MKKLAFVFVFLIFCSLLCSYSHAYNPFIELFDFSAMKFSQVKNEISRGIIIVRNLNEEKINYIKRSFAPWQRLLLRNELNEVVEVEIFFQTRNDFYSPPVKRQFLLKKIVLQPKEEIILLFPINRWGIEEKYGVKGRFFIYSRSFQRTASGMFVSGEMKKKINLSYRHYRKIVFKIENKKISLK
ncbi:hypothetical protein J7K91_01395, partial [bacterium]|nr:hypothetical protein [bacterium]